MNTSEFKKYSIGIVAQDKLPTTDEIEVTPIEALGYLDGQIDTTQTPLTHAGVDAKGNQYTVSVTASNTLRAKWHNLAGGNRATSPDVCVGERVQIWKYADHDEYFWTDTNDAQHLRSLETVRHVYSANTDPNTTQLDATNSYYHEVSTHNGTMTMGTSKANGEPFGYTAQINAKAGSAQLTDDKGNTMFMDSNKQMVGVQNSAGSFIKVVGTNCEINVPKAITVTFDSITFNGQTFTSNAKKVVFTGTSWNSTFTQMTLAGGNLAIQMATAFTGAAVATFNAAANFLGAITHLGKGIGSTHTHTSSTPGNPTSGVN